MFRKSHNIFPSKMFKELVIVHHGGHREHGEIRENWRLYLMSSPYPCYILCELCGLCGELNCTKNYIQLTLIYYQKNRFLHIFIFHLIFSAPTVLSVVNNYYLYRYLKENFIVIHQWRYLLSALHKLLKITLEILPE